jgi:GNAT superfamily N-acetyltransferase
MEIKITWYKDSMKSQVIALFENQYATPPGYFTNLFDAFYFHPYQKNKCLLIVALDGETVAGFQSFFYWPYTLGDKKFNSFQSGNSLVHPDYRGKGIFQRLLAFVDQENKNLGLDFFVGFPIQASIKNLLKDKWQNILNLTWFLKICNPFGFLPGRLKNIRNITPGITHLKNSEPPVIRRLSVDAEFTAWRNNYLADGDLYYTYHFKQDSSEILFHLKKNKRKIFNEVIVGNVLFNTDAARSKLTIALKEMNNLILRSFSAHFISCAINSGSIKTIEGALINTGFRKINKTIYFAVKPFKDPEAVLDPSSWELYRSDIDTW